MSLLQDAGAEEPKFKYGSCAIMFINSADKHAGKSGNMKLVSM